MCCLGNVKDSLMKLLNILQRSIIVLLRALSYYGTKTRVKFDGSCLKQCKITFTHGK